MASSLKAWSNLLFWTWYSFTKSFMKSPSKASICALSTADFYCIVSSNSKLSLLLCPSPIFIYNFVSYSLAFRPKRRKLTTKRVAKSLFISIRDFCLFIIKIQNIIIFIYVFIFDKFYKLSYFLFFLYFFSFKF